MKSASKSKISRIYIDGLFGKYNYNFSTKEWLTILIAPNGYGKTTIFKMIDIIFNYNWRLLAIFPFSKIRVEFLNNLFIEINKSKEKLKFSNNFPRLNLEGKMSFKFTEFLDDIYLLNEFINHKEIITKDPLRFHSYISMFPTSIEDNGSLLSNENSMSLLLRFIFPANYVIKLLHHYNSIAISYKSDEISEIINFLKSQKGNNHGQSFKSLISFVDSNRVISSFYSSIKSKKSHLFFESIDIMSQSIMQNINDFNIELQNSVMQDYPTVEIKPRLKDKMKEIVSFYGSHSYWRDSFEYLEECLKLNKLPKKIEPLVYLLGKVFYFIQICNKHFDISLSIGKKEITAKNGLDLNLLSSGEKNIILVFYYTLVTGKYRSLVLIDEPEISLHPGWLTKFLTALEETKKITQQNFVIATHSPDLIHDKFNFLYDMVNQDDR